MREPEFDIEMAVPSIRGAGLGLLRYRFTLFRLLMAIFLIGIILAFLVQTRPVGQAPKIVCSLAFSRSGKCAAVAKLDDQYSCGRRYTTRTISIIDLMPAKLMVVVERELVRAILGNAVNNWYYDDPLIGFSAHDDSLLIEGCDGSGIRRYDRSAELETYPIADMDSEPFRKHTQVAVSRDPGTYAIWDVDTGLACRYHPPICTARMHKSIIETTSPNDWLIIADQDVRAIANARPYAFAPIGHGLAVQYVCVAAGFVILITERRQFILVQRHVGWLFLPRRPETGNCREKSNEGIGCRIRRRDLLASPQAGHLFCSVVRREVIGNWRLRRTAHVMEPKVN